MTTIEKINDLVTIYRERISDNNLKNKSKQIDSADHILLEKENEIISEMVTDIEKILTEEE